MGRDAGVGGTEITSSSTNGASEIDYTKESYCESCRALRLCGLSYIIISTFICMVKIVDKCYSLTHTSANPNKIAHKPYTHSQIDSHHNQKRFSVCCLACSLSDCLFLAYIVFSTFSVCIYSSSFLFVQESLVHMDGVSSKAYDEFSIQQCSGVYTIAHIVACESA